MDFGSALIALKAGLKVRRKIWEEGRYIKVLIHPNYRKSWFYCCTSNSLSKFSLLARDVMAEDWEQC